VPISGIMRGRHRVYTTENRIDRMVRPMFRSILRLLIVTAFLAYSWGRVQPVSAEGEAITFTVDSAGDETDSNPGDGRCATVNNTCTLRAAIEESKNLAGTETVIIPAMTIYISAGFRLSTVWDGQLSKDVSINIQGAGEDKTIIDAQHLTRVFYFGLGSGNHSISNLTIRNAENKFTEFYARNGGGIYNQAVLTVTNVTITTSRAYQGGGIFNEHDNQNPNVQQPKLILHHVTLTNNVATAGETGYGGGGLFNGCMLEGDDVVITNNFSDYGGGGFNNNTYHYSRLTHFVISNNKARIGGGIHSDFSVLSPNNALVLEDGVISGNTAFCCHPSGGLVVGGAGIFNNEAYMILRNVAISNNNVPNNVKVGGYGGGIANAQYMELDNVSITGNQATYGAGIQNGNRNNWPNKMTLVNVTISGNLGPDTFPDSQGAAIFNIDNGKISLYNTTITNNQADATGGIENHSNNNTRVEIMDSILAGNTDIFKVEDCRGTLYSLGYNIIANYLGNPSKNMICNVNPLATDRLGLTPAMGPLVGSPAYHPLLQGSLAIDSGTLSQCPGDDIRGILRPQGTTCDVGSYEYQDNFTGSIKTYLPMIVKGGR
jgi:CSLREA domain-containing protein